MPCLSLLHYTIPYRDFHMFAVLWVFCLFLQLTQINSPVLFDKSKFGKRNWLQWENVAEEVKSRKISKGRHVGFDILEYRLFIFPFFFFS